MLTTIDRWFIQKISLPYADKIELALSSKAQIVQSSSVADRNRMVNLASGLFQYGLLCLELVTISRHSSPVESEVTLFFDPQLNRHNKRIEFLTYMMEDNQFLGISRENRICLLPDKKFIFYIMPILLAAILWAFFMPRSTLSPHYVWVVRVCLLTLGHIAKNSCEGVYVFSISGIEVPFLASFLKEHGITVNLVASMTPLSFYNRVLIGSSLKAATAYQCDEFEHYQHLGDCPECELWAPETIPYLIEHYRGQKIHNNINTIGIYTQGFWLRAKLGIIHPDVIFRSINREEELLEAMLEWSESHPHVNLLIFPHPLERRHLHATGEHQFKDLLARPNVEVDLSPSENSFLQFDRIGLGVTTLSSIGFERIHIGLRTLFYNLPIKEGLNAPDPQVESKYNEIFIDERKSFLEAVERCRQMSNQEFMNHYFGQEDFWRDFEWGG